MIKPTRILSCAAVLSALCLAACDEEYDLSKDINTDIQIGNQFRIPAGRTDTIYVSRIIEESETLTENNGIYEVSSKGNTVTHIDPFDEVEIHNFTPELENVRIDIPQRGSVPSGTVVNTEQLKSSGNYGIDEELPQEVVELYCADFKGGTAPTYLKLSVNALPEGVESVTLSDLVMTFPDFIHLTDGSNQFHIDQVELDATNLSSTYTINVEMLELGHDEQERYIINGANGRKHLVINDALEITANTSMTLGGNISAQYVEVIFEYYMDSETTNFNSIAGLFTTTANISSNIAINDIPDFLRNENTQLSPQEVYVYLDLDNTVNVSGNLSLDMTSTSTTQSGQASASIEVEPATMNNILISNFNASVPGYTTVEEPSLANLFQFVPDNISIASDDLVFTSTDNSQMIELGRGYDITADYRAVVPFKFNNLNIEYTDTIDNLLSDLEDVADKTDRLIARGVGVTNIPTDLVASVKLYDIYGNELNGIDVDLSKFRLTAAPDGGESTNEMEMILTEREGSDDFERLEEIVFTINAATTENITLRPSQYLVIKDIFIEIPDGIKLTL